MTCAKRVEFLFLFRVFRGSSHRLNQKRMYLQQSQGVGLQAHFNQMQIAEGSYPAGSSALDPAASPSSAQGPAMSAAHQPQAQQQATPQASPPFPHPHSLSPLMEPGEGLAYDYMGPSQHHYPQQMPPGCHLRHLHSPHPHEASAGGLGFCYPAGCEQQVLGLPNEALLLEHVHEHEFPLDPALLPPPALAGSEAGHAQSEELGSLLDCEMMETVDSQHGFVMVN